MSWGKRGVLYYKGAHVPQRAEQGRGREGGIKGQRDRFLWCVFPQGQRGGLELLPWQIWRCPVLLFLCSPSSCRKQHHAGHQILGKLWWFTVLTQERVNMSLCKMSNAIRSESYQWRTDNCRGKKCFEFSAEDLSGGDTQTDNPVSWCGSSRARVLLWPTAGGCINLLLRRQNELSLFFPSSNFGNTYIVLTTLQQCAFLQIDI